MISAAANPIPEKLLANLPASANRFTKQQLFTVPRKSKSITTENGDVSHSDRALPEAKGANVTTRRKSTTAKKPQSAGKKRPSVGKKSNKQQVAKGVQSIDPAEPTDEEIRIRAYFIAERRHQLALPGDTSSDWLEAKRQLLAESGRR